MLGEKIAKKRKMINLSQEALAEKLSVSRSAVAKWESNKGKPDIENLKALSKVLNTSIDTLLDNQIFEDHKYMEHGSDSDIKSDEKVQAFINQKCTVQLTDWNDGIFDGYLVAYDGYFLYFLRQKAKKNSIVGLSKKFITEIELNSPKDQDVLTSFHYSGINRGFFLGKRVNIVLDEKHFWSGLIGKDTEYLDVEICSFSESSLIITKENGLSDIEIPIGEVTKIEII